MPQEDRYFWIFDRTVYDQIRLPGVDWQEAALILLALGAFVAYTFTIKYLEHRGRVRRRRAKQRARLQQWLARAGLAEYEREALARLAGGDDERRLYALLGNPVTFETRIHEAIEAGHGGGLGFTESLRDVLGYRSDNLRIPLASTRQLLPGDAVRVATWVGGLPRHFYGQVVEGGMETLVLSLRPEGVQAAEQHPTETDIYVLRGGEIEYRFPCRVMLATRDPGHLVVHHALVAMEHGPRGARLPLMRDIHFRERDLARAEEAGEGAGEGAPAGEPPEEGAILFDLSEGGFAMITGREISRGRYVSFELPLKRGRRRFPLTGRVVESRPFGGTQWMTRCEARGLTSRQRNLLLQIVRMEQQRRLEAMAPVVRARHRRRRPVPGPPA